MTKKNGEISAVEAARRLGVGLDYLYGLIWTGKLIGRKVQNRWRVSTASVESRSKALRAQNG
jgi:excisionase family DNA binding protein